MTDNSNTPIPVSNNKLSTSNKEVTQGLNITDKLNSKEKKSDWWWGTGRRKAATARVRIKSGTGHIKVNKRDLDEYFTEERDQKNIRAVLQNTRTQKSLDVHVNVQGGGFTGQSGAIILGIGRALRKYDTGLESILKSHGYLTRDARKVERKKPGMAGARKSFQFSKR